MEILNRKPQNLKLLEYVQAGEVFEYHGQYFIKTDEERDGSTGPNDVWYVVVNLYSGETSVLQSVCGVDVLDADVYIN